MLFKRSKKTKKPLPKENGKNCEPIKVEEDEVLEIGFMDGKPVFRIKRKVYLGKSKRFWTYE